MGGSRSRSRSPVFRRGERRRSRSRSLERPRDKDREKDRRRVGDRHRSRSRSPPARHRRSRSRSPRRRRSRTPSGDRSRSRDPKELKVPKHQQSERPPITDADLEGKTEDEIEMMKKMGFGNFETTKGKKVRGNVVYAVNTIHKRKYRQYMNRKGGFNRPLDFVA